MKTLRQYLTVLIVTFAVSHITIAQTGSVSLAPSGTQIVTQPVSPSGVRSTLGVNSLNNTYYVNQWCATPGVLDDTCFSKAITDIQANALIGYDGRRMQVLIVSPGVYTFNHTVMIPTGINISIKGEYQAGIWGSVISPGTSQMVLFLVQADNVEIQHLSFLNAISKFTGVTAIQMGTTTLQPTTDSHINWCWFNSVQEAIHIVNGSGYDLSHNTFDSGTTYGIYSNAAAGDISATDIIATDLRGFSQTSTINITGPSARSPNFEGYTFSGIFDHSVQDSAPIYLNGVIAANISGTFNNNNYNDIQILNSHAVVISNFQVFEPGQTSIYVSGSQGVQISNGVFFDSNTLTPGTPMISVNNSGNTTVNDLTSLNEGVANASVGLYVDPTSNASAIYGNNFHAQTGAAYDVLDTTAAFTVMGNLNATQITAANGFTGSKTIGACTLTISGGIITNVSGC